MENYTKVKEIIQKIEPSFDSMKATKYARDYVQDVVDLLGAKEITEDKVKAYIRLRETKF